MSNTKLHFADNGNQCTIYLYTGEAWSDENKVILKEAVVDADAVPDALTAGEETFSLKQYGLKKILQDRNSDEKDKAAKFDGMLATYEQLKSGVWRVASEKGEPTPRGSKQVDPFLAAAIAEVSGKSVLEVSVALQAKSKEERKALAEHEKVKPVIERLKAEIGTVDLGL